MFNSALSNSVRLMTLPDRTSTEEVSTPCYVPTTREVWVPYNTAAGASIAIIDPDALVIKAVVVMDMATPGPAFYNPVKDEVVVHDHSGGGQTLYYNPQTRVGVAGHNLFGDTLDLGPFIASITGNCTEVGSVVGAKAWTTGTKAKIFPAEGPGTTTDPDYPNLLNYCVGPPWESTPYWPSYRTGPVDPRLNVTDAYTSSPMR